MEMELRIWHTFYGSKIKSKSSLFYKTSPFTQRRACASCSERLRAAPFVAAPRSRSGVIENVRKISLSTRGTRRACEKNRALSTMQLWFANHGIAAD